MMNVSERSVTDCENFWIPIGSCLKVSFQFVFRLIIGYVSSFFFKFLIFCIAFRFNFCKLQYFLSQYYY